MKIAEFAIWAVQLMPILGFIHDGRDSCESFSNEWIVELDGGPTAADRLAETLDYENTGEIDGFPNYYLLKKSDHPEENVEEAHVNTRSLESDYKVTFAQQLFRKSRVKRRPDQMFDRELLGNSLSEEILLEKPVSSFNDPLWNKQWYMTNTMSRDGLSQVNLHVTEVYDMGYTGKGVRVSVLDDGLEHDHADLHANYDPEISAKYSNCLEKSDDPRPDGNKTSSHGTRCAGEIGMVANNNFCGVGVAHGAKIGGVKMLDVKTDDCVEGKSLKHALDKVDIYTSSWGPKDDGKTVEGPGRMAYEALEEGVTKGRNGKGAIYVWASGNGGRYGDNCNCDGYTSNIRTVSIGSASEDGEFPWYGEKCASTMAVAFSSGDFAERKISTTDMHNTCTDRHTGTSAAAPLAAGVIALALEANPDLTWRDVHHLVVWTSSADGLASSKKPGSGWWVNGASLRYNHRFGFGAINAKNMVEEALRWVNVGPQEKCTVQVDRNELDVQGTRLTFPINLEKCNINSIEHVQLFTSIEYPVRGKIQVILHSPSGTKSHLLSERERDTSSAGFTNWPFTSVHFWGEKPVGSWMASFIFSAEDERGQNIPGNVGKLKLNVYGTQEVPEIMKRRNIQQADGVNLSLLKSTARANDDAILDMFLGIENAPRKYVDPFANL